MNAEVVESRVVAFFNDVRSPVEIQQTIRDDPNFGRPLRYGISISTARRILTHRKRLPGGKFTSLREIDAVPGVGPSTLHNIHYTFWLKLAWSGDPLWRLHIEGVVDGRFLDVEGLESITEVHEMADGDTHLIRKRPGRSECANLILRRHLTADRSLENWYRATVEGQVQRKDGELALLSGYKIEVVRKRFSEAWPFRWRCAVERAEGRTVTIEEIELVVESLERVSS